MNEKVEKPVPFTRKEIVAEKDGFPSRGDYCPSCRVNIPVFAELSNEDELRVRALGSDRKIDQIRLLREITGCGLRWAKIWVSHPDGPQQAGFKDNAQCSYCGGLLRSAKARQCPHCLTSWHDPKNVKKLI